MLITSHLFEAYLKCHTKCFLLSSAKRGPETAIRIGFKLSKLLIVVRRLIALLKKQYLLFDSKSIRRIDR